MSYESIALVDRIAAISDPEEIWTYRDLVAWADEHGYGHMALLAALVGDDAYVVDRALWAMDGDASTQTRVAGVTLGAWDAIEFAWEQVPSGAGDWARWEAAYAAASRCVSDCASWAALADVALCLDWVPTPAVVRELRDRGLTEVLRAAVAVRSMLDGADPIDAWTDAMDVAERSLS